MSNQYLSNTDPMAKALILRSGGGADSTTDLQFNGGLKSGETFSRSALVSLDENRKIRAGLAADTSMPMWAINGAQDYDAGQFNYNLRKDVEGDGQGMVNCLVAVGGFELAVTEYNSTDFTSSQYTPGQCLLTDDTDTAGYVKPAPTPNYNDVTIVGCVSYGIESSDNRGLPRARARLSQKQLLRFWTMFIPPVKVS